MLCSLLWQWQIASLSCFIIILVFLCLRPKLYRHMNLSVLPLKAKNDAAPHKTSPSVRCSTFHLTTLMVKGCDLLLNRESCKMYLIVKGCDLLLDRESYKMEYKHPILKNEHLANLKHPNRVWSPWTGENLMITDLLLTQDLQEDLQSSRSSSCSMAAPRQGWRRSTSENLHLHLSEVLYIP